MSRWGRALSPLGPPVGDDSLSALSCAKPPNFRTPGVRSPSASWDEEGARTAAGPQALMGWSVAGAPRTPRQP